MFDWLKRLFRSRPTDAATPEAEERLVRPLLDQLLPSGKEGVPLDTLLAVANGRPSPAMINKARSEARRQLREGQGTPNALFWSNLIDPTEPIWDDTDFWLPLGFGQNVPWTLNNTLKGEVLPVYINEYGLKIIRDWSRRLLAFNEFALNAIEKRVSYVVGKGFQYKAVLRRHPPTTEQDIDNDSGVETNDLCRRVQEVLDEFIDRERWGEREQECVRRCDRDGEALLRFFHTGGGKTAVRFVEPELLTDQMGLANSEYGIVSDPEDIETVLAYQVVECPQDGWHAVEVPAEEVVHIKLNTDFTSKRGLPTLFPVRKNLERADKLLRNMSILAQVQATFAVIRKHRQFSPSSVQAYQQGQGDQDITLPVTGRTLQMQQLFPGSIIDSSDKTDYEFPGAKVDASGLVGVLQAELRAVAARLVMPEYMLTVDASNANYASTLVAEAPAVKNFERLQAYFARRFGDGQYGEERNCGALWRVVRNAVEYGDLPREALTAVEIQVEGPSLVVRNKGEETSRAKTLRDAGLLSDSTWAKWEGLDYEQEKRHGAKPAGGGGGAGGGPGGGGGGGEPPTSAPPGSAGGVSALSRFGEGILLEAHIDLNQPHMVFGKCYSGGEHVDDSLCRNRRESVHDQHTNRRMSNWKGNLSKAHNALMDNSKHRRAMTRDALHHLSNNYDGETFAAEILLAHLEGGKHVGGTGRSSGDEKRPVDVEVKSDDFLNSSDSKMHRSDDAEYRHKEEVQFAQLNYFLEKNSIPCQVVFHLHPDGGIPVGMYVIPGIPGQTQ